MKPETILYFKLTFLVVLQLSAILHYNIKPNLAYAYAYAKRKQ